MSRTLPTSARPPPPQLQTNLSFGRDFTLAVERKQVAQQEAERQRFIVERDAQEKKVNVIRAEGVAEAAELVSVAYNSYGRAHLEIERIKTAKYIAETLSRSRNVTYIPDSANILLGMGN